MQMGGGYLSKRNILYKKGKSFIYNKAFSSGFTLIELLAVIVILSLIALIAIPMIMNVIESSRKGAYTESLRNLIKAVEYYEASEEILGNTIDFEEGLSVFDSNIEMKNKNFITGKIKKNEEGELYLELVSDGVYCGEGTINKLNVIKGSCGDLDTTVPSDIVITENKVTSNSITVAVSVTIGHSGVKYYEYSMDGGSTYTRSDNSSYTFTGLSKDTVYSIKVRVTGGNNLTGESEIVTVHTSDVDVPTYVVENAGHWSTSKKVTITYPEVEGYTYEYSLDKGVTWVSVENTNIDIPFTTNGTLVARVTDGVNVVLGESIGVTKITGTEISDYIQDGLQVFYDGLNATGTGPNSNTSSTRGIWKDLSGNGRDGTLVDFDFNEESGWVENGLSFAGEKNFVLIDEMNYQEITLEAVASVRELNDLNYIMSNVQTGGYALYFSNWSVQAVGVGSYRLNNNKYYWHRTNIVDNGPLYVAGRLNDTSSILNYNQDRYVSDGLGPIGTTLHNTYMVLGANPYQMTAGGAENLRGCIYVARAYNRVLTDDEIEKNYVIDKARYGF